MQDVLSPMLRPGDLVSLVSPASAPAPEWLDAEVAVLESWGLQVAVGAHALDTWAYMAGTDTDRLSDLNQAFRDPNVRAVITTRGGAGAYRIWQGMDFDAVADDPKPLVGFSDITYLHLPLWQRCQLATIHGSLGTPRSQECTRTLLMTTDPVTVVTDPTEMTSAVNVPGKASGVLLGGNLPSLISLIGAGLPRLTGAILLIEAVRTIGLGQVDRQLTHLIQAGALDGVSGIAIGQFTKFDDYTDHGWNLVDVMNDRLSHLGIPVLGGLPLGHGLDPYSVSLGTPAVLDADEGTLTVGSPVTS